MSDEPQKFNFNDFHIADAEAFSDPDKDYSQFTNGLPTISGSFTGKLVKGAGVPPRPSRVRGWRPLPLMPDSEPDRSL